MKKKSIYKIVNHFHHKKNSLALFLVFIIVNPLSHAAFVETLEPNTDQSQKLKSLLNPNYGSDLSTYDNSEILKQYINNFDVNNAASLLQEALSYLKQGNTPQAIIYLNRAWQAEPSLAEVGIKISLLHLQNQEYKPALIAALKVQKIVPKDPLAYKLAGIAYAFLNDNKKLKLSFKKALELQPGAPDASLALAKLALLEGHPDQAQQIYKNSLKYYPANLRTLILLAELESEAGEYQKSLATVQKAIQHNPTKVLPRYILIKMFLLKKNYKQSTESAQAALKQFPNNATFLELLGISQLRNGAPQKAITTFKSIIDNHPDIASPHYNLALAYESIADYNQAITQLKSGLKADPKDLPMRFSLARLLAKVGDLKLARLTIDALIESHPEDFQVLKLGGQIALAQKDHVTAVKLFQQAQNINNTSPVTVKLAYALMKNKQLDAAFSVLEKHVRSYPDDLWTKKSLVDFYLAESKQKKAEKLLKDIISREKNKSEIGKAKKMLKQIQGMKKN